VFVARFTGGVRVAVTGASEDGVFRWTEAEKNLSKSFSAEVIDSLAVDPADMIADAHASQEYRAHLVGIMTKRAVSAAGT
jgi:carbon-monoxide dehydrogenase medium subunit